MKASFIVDPQGLVLCHERQDFFFFLAVLFQEGELPVSVSFITFLKVIFISDCVGCLCPSGVFF